MRIYIASTAYNLHIAAGPGNVWSLKKAFTESSYRSGTDSYRSWVDTIKKIAGSWVAVETDFLFATQFNIEQARIDMRYVSCIDFAPEFQDIDDYMAHVQKRYDKDWPGVKVDDFLRNSIACGNIGVYGEWMPFGYRTPERLVHILGPLAFKGSFLSEMRGRSIDQILELKGRKPDEQQVYSSEGVFSDGYDLSHFSLKDYMASFGIDAAQMLETGKPASTTE